MRCWIERCRSRAEYAYGVFGVKEDARVNSREIGRYIPYCSEHFEEKQKMFHEQFSSVDMTMDIWEPS